MNHLRLCLLVFLACAGSGFAQVSTLVQSPRTKHAEFTGSEVLFILGIDAFKCEVRFTRPQKVEKIALVVGRTENAKNIEEETNLGEYRGFPAVSSYTVGLALRPEQKQLITILDGGMTLLPLPDGFKYDYSRSSGNGIYDGGLVIFAYEPRDQAKEPTSKVDCTRYLGVRLYLKD